MIWVIRSHYTKSEHRRHDLGHQVTRPSYHLRGLIHRLLPSRKIQHNTTNIAIQIKTDIFFQHLQHLRTPSPTINNLVHPTTTRTTSCPNYICHPARTLRYTVSLLEENDLFSLELSLFLLVCLVGGIRSAWHCLAHLVWAGGWRAPIG